MEILSSQGGTGKETMGRAFFRGNSLDIRGKKKFAIGTIKHHSRLGREVSIYALEKLKN